MAINFRQAVRISVLSTTYVLCRVSTTEGGAAADPTTGDVYFAFVDEADNTSPASSAWVAGSWESGTDGYWARCLVGPDGTTELSEGNYDVWVKVSKSLETVVSQVGALNIY
jgi:hypothetical protein